MNDPVHLEPDWVDPPWAMCGMTMGPFVCGCKEPVDSGRIFYAWFDDKKEHPYPECKNCRHPLQERPA